MTIAYSFDEHWLPMAGPLESPCHIWQRGTNSSGRGTVAVAGRTIKAHRFSYERTHGPIPAGLCVRHRCDDLRCVNPSHLILGTQKDNVRDRDERNRAADVSGSCNPSAKLNENDVERIREILKIGGVTQKKLAPYFGVSHALINAIAKGRLWNKTSECLS